MEARSIMAVVAIARVGESKESASLSLASQADHIVEVDVPLPHFIARIGIGNREQKKVKASSGSALRRHRRNTARTACDVGGVGRCGNCAHVFSVDYHVIATPEF